MHLDKKEKNIQLFFATLPLRNLHFFNMGLTPPPFKNVQKNCIICKLRHPLFQIFLSDQSPFIALPCLVQSVTS